MFGKKEYVYLLSQDKLMNDEAEKALKKEVHNYINKSMNSIWTTFNKKKIVFFDYFSSNHSHKIYSYFLSFMPETNPKFEPLVYEMYAFTFAENIEIFKDYDVEMKTFSNENQEIKLYKIKI